MAPKTVTQALKDMLFSLSKMKLEEFCSAFLDRKGEPRVKRKDLEDKSPGCYLHGVKSNTSGSGHPEGN